MYNHIGEIEKKSTTNVLYRKGRKEKSGLNFTQRISVTNQLKNSKEKFNSTVRDCYKSNLTN